MPVGTDEFLCLSVSQQKSLTLLMFFCCKVGDQSSSGRLLCAFLHHFSQPGFIQLGGRREKRDWSLPNVWRELLDELQLLPRVEHTQVLLYECILLVHNMVTSQVPMIQYQSTPEQDYTTSGSPIKPDPHLHLFFLPLALASVWL